MECLKQNLKRRVEEEEEKENRLKVGEGELSEVKEEIRRLAERRGRKPEQEDDSQVSEPEGL